MIKQFATKSCDFLLKAGAIDKNNNTELEWIKYGIELSLSSIIGMIVVLGISIYMRCLLNGLLFLVVFIPLRQFTGGYHANTYLSCNLVFSIGYLSVVYISTYLSYLVPQQLQCMVLVFELILIFFLAPVKNRYKPIKNKMQFIKCKITSFCLYFMFGAVGILCLNIFPRIANTIINTLHLISLLGIIGYFKERSYTHDEISECNS